MINGPRAETGAVVGCVDDGVVGRVVVEVVRFGAVDVVPEWVPAGLCGAEVWDGPVVWEHAVMTRARPMSAPVICARLLNFLPQLTQFRPCHDGTAESENLPATTG